GGKKSRRRQKQAENATDVVPIRLTLRKEGANYVGDAQLRFDTVVNERFPIPAEDKLVGAVCLEPLSAWLFGGPFTVAKYEEKPTKKAAHILSTIHHQPLVSVNSKCRPEPIEFYNRTKIGVDLAVSCSYPFS